MRTYCILTAVIAGLSTGEFVSARAEVIATNRTLPGVTIYSEFRAEPPTRLFVAEVDLTHPKVRVHVARGGRDPDGKGPWQTQLKPPTVVASREHYDLVVNGDFFRARGIKDAEGTNSRYRQAIWSSVLGPAESGGSVWSTSTNPLPCLVVHKDRKVSIDLLTTPPRDAREVVAGNTMLVENGAMVPHRNQVRHPRTAVGLNAAGTKLIVLVVDGRKPGRAVGMSYDELAAELIRLGCHQALNLDGGGSSVMALKEAGKKQLRILNEPTDGHERAVANVLGITVHRRWFLGF